MATNDKVTSADEVFADIVARGAEAGAPLHPCPACGLETKEHHTPVGSRICSGRECRTVVENPVTLEAMARAGQALQPVVYPCPTCGAPTKEHHTPAGSRICSVKSCRTVVAPAG